MRGKVLLNGKPRMGLIRIGQHGVGTLDLKCNRTIWENNGTIIFEGKANIGSGVRLSTVNRESVIIFGDKFCVTGGSSIVCCKSISFGKECLLSWDILIMDTDFHNVLNINGEVINYSKPIKIGDKVWIGCRNTILKGVSICNNIVIAAGSKITSDITQPNCIVGGTEKQRIIKENIYWSN